jgi:glycosyltransferase involved in cell wall biosynthesis
VCKSGKIERLPRIHKVRGGSIDFGATVARTPSPRGFGSTAARAHAEAARIPDREVRLVDQNSPALARTCIRVSDEPVEREVMVERAGDYGGLWVGQVELANGLRPEVVPGGGAERGVLSRLLVRLHDEPLGFVTVPSSSSAAALATAIVASLQDRLSSHLAADGIEMPIELPVEGLHRWGQCALKQTSGSYSELPISVAICTRDRPEQLRGCLTTIREVRYPHFEVVVVDNAPSDDRTRQCVEMFAAEDVRFRYCCEPEAGLSRARNRALAAAEHDHIAFTDDDVFVDPTWLEGVARGFQSDPLVGCVTGLVPPARLDSRARQYFDNRLSWSGSFASRVYDLGARRGDNALYPYSPGIFGTGASLAVERGLMQQLGGFDPALGAGSPSGGGEDLDAFVRILYANRAIAFEPGAIVWHVHRGADDELRRQLYNYGLGFSAFLTKQLCDPNARRAVLQRIPDGARRLARAWSQQEVKDSQGGSNLSHLAAEMMGMVGGPRAYWRGRRALDVAKRPIRA